MSQGRAFPTELRARVLAAILGGATITAAARAHGVDKRIVSKWVQGDATLATLRSHERDPETLLVAIVELIHEHITTLRAQMRATADVDYLREQPAGAIAELMTVESASLLRLLAGLRPIEPQ